MKKKLAIGTLIIVGLAIVYFLVVRPLTAALTPKTLKDIVNERIEQYRENWDGRKWEEFAHLSNDQYVMQNVISDMLKDGAVSREQLTAASNAKIDQVSNSIRSSEDWLSAVEDQVGPENKFQNLVDAIYWNAIYVVMTEGKLALSILEE
jgi:hypothetical protein